MSFKDYFSRQAADYARFRPRYPAAMFEFLVALASQRDVALDCATGNGQAAVALAQYFRRVIATDASAKQIANAEQHERIEYRIALAETSGLEADTIDLIMVAQALHWFDVEAFNAEARRLLKRGGILAVSCYNLLTIAPEIDAVVNRFYFDVVGPCWPPERALIEREYRDLAFPFELLPCPEFAMGAHWSLQQLTGYLRTWSATQKFIAIRGYDPVEETERALSSVWGGPDRKRGVSWPLLLRVGRSD